jgi:hypothetical protein
MRDAIGLLHNMSAPPKSVLRYGGLAGLASQHGPGGSGVTKLSYTAKEFFGTPVRFAFDHAWTKLSAVEILNYLQVEVVTSLPANSQAGVEPSVEQLKALNTARAHAATRQLNALINQRAQAMPLPEGCAVIVPRPEHAVLFADLLSTLAIFSKCTESVWLRSKTPSLIAARGYKEVSLLIPPNFCEQLLRFSC